VLRRIFGPKREEVGGDWRRMHNEELHNSYTSPHTIRMVISRRMRSARHVARMGELRNLHNILVGKPGGKRPLGRSGNRREDNIRMDISETKWQGVDWMHVAQERDKWRALVNTVMNLRVP
jgi:hypothetical protein